MEWKTIKEEEGKIRRVVLKNGREYLGRIISVSVPENENDTDSIVTMKDKYGVEIIFSWRDIMVIEKINI